MPRSVHCAKRLAAWASRRWGLFAIPVSAWLFLLLVEGTAAVLTIGVLCTEPGTRTTVVRFVVLAVLTISYGELAIRSERIKRYLGADRAFVNPMSVWSFPQC